MERSAVQAETGDVSSPAELGDVSSPAELGGVSSSTAVVNASSAVEVGDLSSTVQVRDAASPVDVVPVFVGPEASPAGTVGVGVPTAPVARRQSSERLANVERLRIIAMLEIVTFHVGGAVGTESYRLPIVAGLGLPVFLVLNNAFNCTLSERMGTRAFLDAKVTKLLLPWLVWSGVYAGLVVAEKLRHAEPVASAFSPWMILGGTYTHLWFVPFALFGSLLIAGLQQSTKAASHRRMAWLTLAGGAALVLLGASVLDRWPGIPWPLPQWAFALPSPLLGFALGRVLLARDRRFAIRIAGFLALVAVATLAVTALAGAPIMLRRYGVSMLLVALFFLWPGQADALSRRLTPLLFGVYLTHPLLVRLYQGAHLPVLPSAWLGLLVFLSSAMLVEGLRRTPLRRLV
jgi:surface polysaccharide O-acyltransferase-like enzyme